MTAQGSRIRSTHTPDGTIVMDVDSGRMFSLNSSGSFMFQLLSDGLDDKSIVDEFVRRFGISAAVAKRDLDEFRSTLNSHVLIKELASPE
jgi:Coenzyme PQQ synthesis protein D (PqqD)